MPILIAVLGFCAAGALALSLRQPAEQPTPSTPKPPTVSLSLASPGPVPSSAFLNTRLDVRYIGSSECGSCHEEIVQSFAAIGMGRSVQPPALGYGGFAGTTPPPFSHEKSGFSYAVGQIDGMTLHEEYLPGGEGGKVYCQSYPMDFAIGSGRLGVTLLLQRDGFLYQSPITWFRDHGWGLSPGYDTAVHSQFSRPITEECLACHTNRVTRVAGSLNRFDLSTPVEPIGCERCHGPGALHVTDRLTDLGERDGIDYTIVNPRHLTTELRDQVCQQCHLEGAIRLEVAGRSLMDYRPGLPLEAFRAVFTYQTSGEGAVQVVGHVEGMHHSPCFQETRDWPAERQLQCTSCHDPHSRPAEGQRTDYYRRRCLACHGPAVPEKAHGAGACTLPMDQRLAAADHCARCHMPSRIAEGFDHTPITDHYIRVFRDPAEAPRIPSDVQLAPFHRGVDDWPEAVRDRYLGLAYYNVGGTGPKLPRKGEQAAVERFILSAFRRAVPLLQQAAEDFPGDAEVWEALASVYRQFEQVPLGKQAARTAVELDPDRIVARATLASMLLAEGDLTGAETHYQRLTEAEPYNWFYWMQLGTVRNQLGRTDAALDALRNALRANPGVGPVHRELGLLLFERGQTREAVEHLEQFFRLPSMDGLITSPAASARERSRAAEALQSAKAALE